MSSPETTTVPVKAVEVNKGTKTVWSKGWFFEGELKAASCKRGQVLLTYCR